MAAGHAYHETGPHRRAIIGGSGEKYFYVVVGSSSDPSLFVAVGRSNLAGSQRPRRSLVVSRSGITSRSISRALPPDRPLPSSPSLDGPFLSFSLSPGHPVGRCNPRVFKSV